MRINNLKKELQLAREKHKLFMENLENSDNPQTKELHDYNCHIVETLNAILSRIDGDKIALAML
jgi:hypothetical protein